MSLFPRNLEEKDQPIIKKMETFYTNSISINQTFWQEADIDHRFEAGDQTLWNELYGNLPANRRRNFNFNRIRRVVNMISGYQRRNRMSTVVIPVENSDQQTADQFTEILMWANRQESILETVSESFHGALISGMNLIHLWMDYRNDPISGDIKVSKCSYNSFLIDPFFRKHDLSDCNGIWKRSYLSKREVISLLPDYADDIMGLPPYESGKDGKFQFMPESYAWNQEKFLTYDEFYYRDLRPQKLLVDTQTGETFEWKVDDEEKLKRFLQLYPQVTVLEQDIPTVRLAIVVQGKVFYDGPNTLGIDNYPFVPVFGYFHPEIPYYPWRIQGVVRGLRDAQYLYNRRKVIELDILESQINSGFKYKENALVNPKDIFLSGQGRGLALKQEANMSDVEQIMPPQIPPSMFQLSESLSREIQEISGVNEELLGSAQDDKAGILSMLRQGAGLTTLQQLFDDLDRSQKLLGKLMINVIQQNFMPGKIQRIISEQPTEQFYTKNFGKYDCAIEEGINTTTQRQMQFAQLIKLYEVGVPIPNESILEAATIQKKSDIIKQIQQAQEAQQQSQQMQMQSALQEQAARTQLAQARATADEGLGLERLSRIQENQQLAVERQAEAQKDRAAALLDIVKALKDLDSIDIAQLEKLIRLQQSMNNNKGDVSAGT